jgi:hypothetical protein
MPESKGALARIERALEAIGISERLAKIANSDLTSLLMNVYRARAAKIAAPALTKAWTDPFLAPSAIDPRAMLELDRTAFELAERFTPVELSPLAPLGMCSTLGPVDQNKIEVTARGREVTSDPSNALVLEIARKRSLDRASKARVDLVASQRVVRTPRVDRPGFTQHFRVLALASGGRARESSFFEAEALFDQLSFHLALLAHVKAEDVKLTLVDRTGHRLEALRTAVAEPLNARFDIAVECTTERASARTYYPTYSFVLEAQDRTGARFPIADGGSVDWLAKLLSDRKEHCVISGIGTQLLVDRFLPSRSRGDGSHAH